MRSYLLVLCISMPFLLIGQSTDEDARIIKQIDSLFNVTQYYQQSRSFASAILSNEQTQKIILENLGKETATYAKACAVHGMIFYSKGDFQEALDWWLESKNILGQDAFKESPEYPESLNRLLVLYNELGQYSEAELVGLETLKIQEKTFGKKHMNYIGTQVNMARLYRDMGNYEKGEDLSLEVIRVFKEELDDRKNLRYQACLVNLGALYVMTGEAKKAEAVFLEAKHNFEVLLDNRMHPFYMNCLINLSALYYQLGIFQKYEPLMLEIKSLMEKLMGKSHPHYAGHLINLSTYYQGLNQLEKAEPLLLEAKDILEVQLKITEHPYYLNCLNNLAVLSTKKGDYEQAESFSLKTIALREKVEGREHPNYAHNLSELANLSKLKGDYSTAESQYMEAKSILEKSVGKNRKYAELMHYFAILYIEMGKYAEAEVLYEELAILDQAQASRRIHHLSEAELNAFLQNFSKFQNQMLFFANTALGQTTNMSKICYDNSLFYKGVLLQTIQQSKRLVEANPSSLDVFNELKKCQRLLAEEYVKPISERKSLTELEDQADGLEKKLALQVSGYSESVRQIRWEEIQQQLETDQAAIEFVHAYYDDKKDPSKSGVYYTALLIRPEQEQPQFVPLFAETALQEVLELNKKEKQKQINELYAAGDQSLYKLIWQPLEAALKGCKLVYFSPSGLLHRLNLSAMASSTEQVLANRFELIQLGSTRQLAIADSPRAGMASQKKEALLFGGIQYDRNDKAIRKANKKLKTLTSRRSLDFEKTDSTLRADKWNYLDWTEVEVASIASILDEASIKTTLRTTYEATEEAFKSIDQQSPHILHLATHGFFFPDPQTSAPTGLAGSESVYKMSEHPMIRSGLILAGGNHAWTTGQAVWAEAEDGVLTAYEISQMDLSDTELVVLSACETGLGDIEGNEGVYGLQRAFKMAGANYLIMSLWQVPDYQTQQLMTTFYAKWLTDKMSIPAAFRAAQQAMREKYREPFLWAGFVLVE